MAGSTLAEAADVGGWTCGERKERVREGGGRKRIRTNKGRRGPSGKQGGRVPRANHTINHRGNSIDGSLLLGGASDACQTFTSPVAGRPAKRRVRFCRVRDTVEAMSTCVFRILVRSPRQLKRATAF